MRLAAVLLVTAGCFAKPSEPGAGESPVPRLLHTAYYSTAGGTPATDHDGFQISTSGVVDGDLLLFIGQIDNGIPSTWPTLPGFSDVSQRTYGMMDYQTNVIEAKIADHEPTMYTGTYMGLGPGTSGASICALVAVSNVDPDMPVGEAAVDIDPSYRETARSIVNDAVTTVPNTTLIYVMSADYLTGGTAGATFERPVGFTKLLEMGDHGDTGLDWGTLMIAYDTDAATGLVPEVTGTTTVVNGTGPITAATYGALIPVQP
jgi:hypothetical protein